MSSARNRESGDDGGGGVVPRFGIGEGFYGRHVFLLLCEEFGSRETIKSLGGGEMQGVSVKCYSFELKPLSLRSYWQAIFFYALVCFFISLNESSVS